MNKKQKNFRKASTITLSALLACTLTLTQVAPLFDAVKGGASTETSSAVKRLDSGKIETNKESFFDTNAVTGLSSAIAAEDEISVIVMADKQTSVLDAYDAKGKTTSLTIGEFAATQEGVRVADDVLTQNAALRRTLERNGISYKPGYEYTTIFSGFEIVIQAKDLANVEKALGSDYSVVVSEVYEPCETEVVTNDVNVFDTGIFDSSDSVYDGSGVVVAVLDTGLDYTHSAFSLDNFSSENLSMTKETLSGVIAKTRASSLVAGLTVDDVYYNAKVPYQFDYADNDADVFPIESEHGTHVSGIIVGNDETIRGVAPNAQLVMMKVFSDVAQGAKNSWILAAVEDCAILGVDVVNMSLGSAAGFAREQDEKRTDEIYDALKEHGISLIAAASNSYNSTFGSTKNGNLGLTSNPDSATVGAPSTYNAALSVASISGTKTPYILFGNEILYFTEASDASAKPRSFVNELLPEGIEETMQFEYVTIPGIGRSADYTGIDVNGKIALVKRGQTTFEDKAKVAQQKGAAGVIIYNNVSGDISMTVGRAKIAVCSISQENGELLAAQETGVISIGRNLSAGPFMSGFSSWGPGPNLSIKPEITAHGGDILSAVPGQRYDRLSGTSMAAPNQAGVTALIRQYVKESFPDIADDDVAVTERVNQIMMSTTDIAYNTNGLAYSVRKQGSGLANLTKATSTPAYITTFKDGEVMDKTKLELGDDPAKTGVYTMQFAVNNVGSSALSYDVDAIVMTEGVSELKTHQGDTTVTEKGYALEDAKVEVTAIEGGSVSGNRITVSGNASAKVTVTITLSDEDKQYLDESFKNGMYVEGFVTLKAADGTSVDLNVCYLAFYGDWSQAPIFDLDYFETNKDELDDSIDTLDKTMADAYATRIVGQVEEDYISYLGSYYFVQDPSATKISATRDHVALSNQTDASHAFYGVFAGLLRNAKYIDIVITDDATGETIYTQQETNQRKSYSSGGGISGSFIDFKFAPADYNLKNNTKYNVKLTARLDYENNGLETNAKNTFEFPFVTDFEAPAVTGVEYYTEYDKTTKKTKLFAKLSVYDNHYAQAAQIGYIYDKDGQNTLESFSRYLTPIYSNYNSTSTVTYELTDYIDRIKSSTTPNTFIAVVYDYALNEAIYEIPVPADIKALYFEEDSITLSPNETYLLNPSVYPEGGWSRTLDYTTSVEGVVNIVAGKLVAVAPGTTVVRATSSEYPEVYDEFTVTVLAQGDEGYRYYDKPVADSFKLTGYYTEKAFYFQSSTDREIGQTGERRTFGKSGYYLSMYPSESVTVQYMLDAYFPDDVEVVFETSNDKIVTVNENGTITAVAEGGSSISVKVLMDGKTTYYSETIYISVKNPYNVQNSWLMNYRGLGGEVILGEELTLTQIYQYAFSNYHYVPKDLEAGDVIDDEDPYTSKIAYLGENETVTKVVIPEGVELIDAYAFAGMAGLEEVVLPSTLKKINQGAFMDCVKLKKVSGLESVQFINQNAFANCPVESVVFRDLVAIGNYAFKNTALTSVELPETAQSIGIGAFANDVKLTTVTINAEKVKIGAGAFSYCDQLTTVHVNAAVLPETVFAGCSALSEIVIGKDVSTIGLNAFAGTAIAKFEVEAGNENFKAGGNGAYLTTADGSELVVYAPKAATELSVTDGKIKRIGDNAFAGNDKITSIKIPSVTAVGNYAFAQCTALTEITLGTLAEVGAYAYYYSGIKTMPSLKKGIEIGEFAFALTMITSLSISDNSVVGDFAFAITPALSYISIGNNVTIGTRAFFASMNTNSSTYQCNSSLRTLVLGNDVTVGNGAFWGADSLTNVAFGENITIGDYAFFYCSELTEFPFDKVTSIGAYAFAGRVAKTDSNGNTTGYYFKTPKFTDIDLSKVESIGEGAFLDNRTLTSVVLNEEMTEIATGVFFNTPALVSVNLENVTSIGLRAFYGSGFTSLDLTNVETIGDGAFASCPELTEVSLKAGAKVDAQAFYSCGKLDTVNGLNEVKYIGEGAFAETLLTSADLTAVEYIGDFAFESAPLAHVILGEKLAYVGENPFLGCPLEAFTKEVEVDFNGQKFTETVDTFDVSDTVKVIDGALYKTVPNGLVFVTYPLAKEETTCSVAEGTVRISSYAFLQSKVVSVELPRTLASIGHMAFYESELSIVTFKSVNAPILEEEYNVYYQYKFDENGNAIAYANHPYTGEKDFGAFKVEGLGIIPFQMWTFGGSSMYYGANFVNYIGKVDRTITMIRPENGVHYDSFIYGQYFSVIYDGQTAPLAETIAAIAAIDKIPANVNLTDKAIVVAAREAFAKVVGYGQQALVTNYSKLTSAEATIEYLENQGATDPDPEPQPVGPETNDNNALVIVLAVLAGVLAAAAVTATVFAVLALRKANKKDRQD